MAGKQIHGRELEEELVSLSKALAGVADQFSARVSVLTEHSRSSTEAVLRGTVDGLEEKEHAVEEMKGLH